MLIVYLGESILIIPIKLPYSISYLNEDLEVAYLSILISMGILEPGFVRIVIETPWVLVDILMAISVDGCASAL
jgi:hypothetical protein